MSTLRADRGRVLDFGEARRAEDAVVRLEAHALTVVLAMVPAELATFARVTRRLELEPELIAKTADGGIAGLGEHWRYYLAHAEAHDPLAPHRVAQATGSVLLLGDVARSEPVAAPFNAYLERLHAIDVAAIYLRVAGATVGMMSLVRKAGEEPFTTRDAMLLRRVHPLLEQAYASALDEAPRPQPMTSPYAGLTAREADVARLVADGARNAEIGCRLGMSLATVKTHLTQVYAKLGVRSRTQLAILLRMYADLDDRPG
jgi:DNA-binding CsgD family transcriptional regulator